MRAGAPNARLPLLRARPSLSRVRLLYLNYGSQSGVTASVSRGLAAHGVEVLHADPTERFLWQLRPGSKIPNLRPAPARAFLEAVRAHGTSWKAYWLHTTFAFDHLSALAGDAIRQARPDAVLQAGVLFGPGRFPEAAYHLYLDHTRAIAERYEAAPGLPPPLPYHPAWRAREQAVYRGAAATFTMSEFAKASLVRDYGVDPGRVHVVGAGPNVEPPPAGTRWSSAFHGGDEPPPAGTRWSSALHGGDEPPPAGTRWSSAFHGGDEPVQGGALATREKAILFVGRKFVPKGGPALLEAFCRVRRSHRDAKLWVVSSSAPAQLPDGAVFHGLLGKEALATLYARASVFALPTLREAFGLSLVEAMSFGIPVVASRVEAIPEIVSDGETGLLVPPSDPAALARALAELLGDPVRARLLGAAGRARAAERFGWERAVSRMLSLMRGAQSGSALAQAGERWGA